MSIHIDGTEGISGPNTPQGGINPSITVSTINDLKTLTARPATVSVQGRTAITDGGGGIFVWYAGDSTTPDDSIIVQPTTGPSGRYKRVFQGNINVKWFGSVGNNSNDDTISIQAAITFAAGLPVYIPKGIYKITSPLTSNIPINIIGDGSGAGPGALDYSHSTIIVPYFNNNYAFDITTSYACSFHDFMISVDPSARPQISGGGIRISGAGSTTNAKSIIKNVAMEGFYRGIEFVRPSYPTITECYFQAWIDAAIHMGTTGNSTYKGAWNANINSPTITSGIGTNGDYYLVTTAGSTSINGINSWAKGDTIRFNGTAWQKNATRSGIEGSGGYIQNNYFFGNPSAETCIRLRCGYTFIENNLILNCKRGIDVRIGNNPAGTVKINDNTIENQNLYGIGLYSDGEAASMIDIHDNEYSVLGESGYLGSVYIDENYGINWLSDLIIHHNTTRHQLPNLNSKHFWIGAGTNIMIDHNILEELGTAGVNGIQITGSSFNTALINPITVENNQFIGTFGLKHSLVPLATLSYIDENGDIISGNRLSTSIGDIPVSVTNLAALKALVIRPLTVTMKGYSTANDGGGGTFIWAAGDNTTADDATVIQCTSGPVGRYKRIFTGPLNVKWFGAKLDGVTDDAAAINAANVAAIFLGGWNIVIPGKIARVASTVQISANNSLHGDNFIPGAPSGGTKILADAGVSVVLQVGDGNNNGTTAIRFLTISRAGGIPSTDKIGILVVGGFNVIIENVMSDNHGKNWVFRSVLDIGAGISAHVTNGYSSRSSDAHFVVDGWPEIYWLNGRFGVNGNSDYNCSTHVRMQGGLNGSAAGPNTITFVGTHFNQGFNKPNHFVEYVDLTGNIPGIDAGNIKVIGCHIEGISSANFYSDATWNAIPRLYMVANSWNTPSIPMFAFNAASATISEWDLIGNAFWCSTFNLSPSNGFTTVNISGGRITGTMSLTGTASSTMTMQGVSHGANATITGTWGQFSRKGCYFTAGGLTVTATGKVDIDDILWKEGNWTPDLKAGGISIPLTLSQGRYQIEGRTVKLIGRIVIDTLSGASGIITIAGMPIPDINDAMNSAGGGSLSFYGGMTGLGGTPLLVTQGGQTYMAVLNPGTTGSASLTAGNLTDNTDMAFCISYFWR